MLMVSPTAYITAKVAISDTGMVTRGMSAARNECRKMTMITSTRKTASAMVVNTFEIERSMKTVESKPIAADTPAGNSASRRGKISLTARATSSGLATACLTMPMESAVSPS